MRSLCDFFFALLKKLHFLRMVCRKDIWGPAAWTLLHCTTESVATGPDGDTMTPVGSQTMRDLVMAVTAALPCPKCRAHFEAQLRAAEKLHGPALWTRRAVLREFLIDAHNAVNRQNGKGVVRADEVPKILNGQRLSGQRSSVSWGLVAAGITIIVLLVVITTLFT